MLKLQKARFLISMLKAWKSYARKCKRAARAYYGWSTRRSVVTVGGVTLPVAHDLSWKVKKRLFTGRYEETEHRLLSKYLREDDKVVDLGAGLGFLTTFSAKKCGSESVVAYEASPEIVKLAKKTFELNDVNPRIEEKAICSSSQKRKILYLREDFWSASLEEGDEHTDQVIVDTVSLNDVFVKHWPSFVIMDIEGSELEFVSTPIPMCLRTCIIEVHPNKTSENVVTKVHSWLDKEGFDITYDSRGDVVCAIRR